MELFTTYVSPFSDLDKMVIEKYGHRSLQAGDPEPITLKSNIEGPLTVGKGYIMCDSCGSIIRRNYLTNHQKSGACSRSVEKQEKRTTYKGPYVALS